MTQQTKNQQQKSGHTHASLLQEVKKQKQKAQELEVAGRHQNDGQSDRNGAR